MAGYRESQVGGRRHAAKAGRADRGQDARPACGMREAGLVTAAALRAAAAAVEPGISTAELDAIAEREIRSAGAVPSFKGYYGYPATICASVNDADRARHPQRGAGAGGGRHDLDRLRRNRTGLARRLRDDGRGGQTAAGPLRPRSRACWSLRAVAVAWPGGRAARRQADRHLARGESRRRVSRTYGIVREYTGHGIGTAMHMDPAVPNYGRAGRGPVLAEGMALAIEPMLMLGSAETRVLDDDWTVVTAGRQPCRPFRAHGRDNRGRALGADRRGWRP